MREELARLVGDRDDPVRAKHLVREALQAKILASLQEAGAMIPLAFCGGTALRFLHALPRYSEDLDFTLERPDRGYDLRAYLKRIRSDLARQGHSVEVRVSDARTVHSAEVKVPGLLYDLGLSPHRSEALSIRLEIDSRPPRGAGLEVSVVRRHELLRLQHHDRASLLSGKLHALLQRRYTKGRDVYDLIWYLADRRWPPPNLDLLRNALAQTGWRKTLDDEEAWRGWVADRLLSLDWPAARRDVEAFLEHPGHAERIRLTDALSVLKAHRS